MIIKEIVCLLKISIKPDLAVSWEPTRQSWALCQLIHEKVLGRDQDPLGLDPRGSRAWASLSPIPEYPPGDFAYNMDQDNARVGDRFMRLIEPVAASLPYMTCPGNHEQR